MWTAEQQEVLEATYARLSPDFLDHVIEKALEGCSLLDDEVAEVEAQRRSLAVGQGLNPPLSGEAAYRWALELKRVEQRLALLDWALQ